MTIHQVRSVWTGFSGAPGYTNFYFSSVIGEEAAGAAIQAVNTFWGSVGLMLPSGVRVETESELTVIDEVTGTIEGYETGDVEGLAYEGNVDQGYSAASGAVINWGTDGVRNGRRIRGRTFIVPLGGDAYQDDGTLTSNRLSSLRSQAESLVANGAGPEFCVWSRPVGGSGGQFAPIVSSRVPDMAAVLRSRRD